MTETTGHAAFHLAHISHGANGTLSDRRKLLTESMRHLDPREIARQAQLNPNIVPSDSRLNQAFVNDAGGSYRVTSDIKEVLDYGNERLAQVTRKMAAQSKTVQTFVVHLPKTLCVEVPNYYPRLKADGTERLDPVTGAPMSRSRWVARNKAEAMRYFNDALAYLSDQVIPGGQPGIHGWATNFDETTPHIQVMADPFAPDPKAKDPSKLRIEQCQAYTSHREVRGADGKQLDGPTKMRNYQTGMREYMSNFGWPVETETGSRHGIGSSKSEYEATRDSLASAESLYTAGMDAIVTASEIDSENTMELLVAQQSLAEDEAFLAYQSHEADSLANALVRKQDEVEAELAELPKLRSAARKEGYSEGRNIAEDEAREHRETAEQLRADAEEYRRIQRAEATRLRALRQSVEDDRAAAGTKPEVPSYDDLRKEILAAQSHLMTRFLKETKLKDGSTLFDAFERYARDKFVGYQSRNTDALGRYGGLDFDRWINRTVAAQTKLRNARIAGDISTAKPTRNDFGYRD